MIGAGINGKAAARTFAARGRQPLLWDVDERRAESAAAEIGGNVAASRDEALAADLVVTVTPGNELLLSEGSLRPGQHASLMGADGPGKAEIAVEELARVRVFCDDWTQASHNGDLVHAVESGVLQRDDVTELGAVFAGDAEGRRSADEIHRLRLDGPGDPGSRGRTGSVRAGRPARDPAGDKALAMFFLFDSASNVARVTGHDFDIFRFIPGYSQHIVGDGKEPVLLLLLAFLITFALTRLYTRLARVYGWGSGSVAAASTSTTWWSAS